LECGAGDLRGLVVSLGDQRRICWPDRRVGPRWRNALRRSSRAKLAVATGARQVAAMLRARRCCSASSHSWWTTLQA